MNACFWAEQELVSEQTCTDRLWGLCNDDEKKSYVVVKSAQISFWHGSKSNKK